MRTLLFTLFFVPFWCFAQYKGVSYELQNETGTRLLSSKTFSHRINNEEGVTSVTDKTNENLLYQFDEFLNGFVGLSNDGRTIVHVQSENDSEPLPKLKITFYRDGRKFDTAELGKLLKYELDGVIKSEKLPRSGWLRNDSLLHKMASSAFYIADDKVFISTDGPLLQVFDMNKMFHIYTGNGANHFQQNYYSIPNLPFRTEFTSSQYFPKEIPASDSGTDFETIIANAAKLKSAIPEEAIYRAEMDILVREDGTSEIRKAAVFSTKTNILDENLSEQLKMNLPTTCFQTTTIPPKHPAWIFSESFWLK